MFLLFLLYLADSIPVATRVVNFSADTILYLAEEKKIVLLGKAKVEYEELSVTSDSIVFDTQEKLLVAYKSPLFRSATDSLRGNKMEYSLKTKKGVMYEGKTAIEKGYFEGKGIWLVEENVLHVTNGYYTTCDKNSPHYCFYSPKLKVFLNDMVVVRPLVLKVFDTPVAVAPFWFFPIARRRKSGLLPFKFGNSKREGHFARGVSYYWAINDYADMTFSVDVMTKKGLRPGIEGRWIIKPITQGEFLSSYIREIDTHRERWKFDLNQSTLLPYDIDSKAHIELQSDASYINEYADTIDPWLKKELNSSATFSKNFPFGNLTLSLVRDVDFQDTVTINELPRLSFSPRPLYLGNLPLSWSASFIRKQTDSCKIRREEKSIHLSSRLSHGTKLFGAYRLSNSITFWKTNSWIDGTYDIKGNYSYSTGLSYHLYRIFGINFAGIHGVLHNVNPSFSLSFSPETIKKKGIILPRLDTLPPVKLNVSIGNVFQAKVGKDKVKKNLLLSSIGMSYNLLNKKISPLSFDAHFPWLFYGELKFSGDYDITEKTSKYRVSWQFSPPPLLLRDTLALIKSLSLALNYSKKADIMLSGGASINPGFGISANFNLNTNLTKKEILYYSIDVNKDLHCWEALFSFRKLGDRWRYEFQVRIKAIPEVAIGKGLLSYILPGE